MTDEDKSRVVAFALRMPASLKTAAKTIADEESISLNRFISLAIAEKVEHHAEFSKMLENEADEESSPGPQNANEQSL
jgi:hypothetical protein